MEKQFKQYLENGEKDLSVLQKTEIEYDFYKGEKETWDCPGEPAQLTVYLTDSFGTTISYDREDEYGNEDSFYYIELKDGTIITEESAKKFGLQYIIAHTNFGERVMSQYCGTDYYGNEFRKGSYFIVLGDDIYTLKTLERADEDKKFGLRVISELFEGYDDLDYDWQKYFETRFSQKD